jgi:lipopolysaccharide transport protein LptA
MIFHLFSFFITLVLLLGAALGSTSWAAATPTSTNDNSPIEITANDTMEWDRQNKTYIARGKAMAVQGDMMIEADQLTAYYSDTLAEGTKISKLIATGSVKITKGTMIGTSENATYDLNSKQAEMNGNVILTTPKEKATATKARYDLTKNIIQLFDNVVITQGANIVKGARAEFDLNTSISRVFGNEAGDTRVKAVFTPQ